MFGQHAEAVTFLFLRYLECRGRRYDIDTAGTGHILELLIDVTAKKRVASGATETTIQNQNDLIRCTDIDITLDALYGNRGGAERVEVGVDGSKMQPSRLVRFAMAGVVNENEV